MGCPNANTAIPVATLPGRMKGRHVRQVIIVQTTLIPDHAVFLVRWRVQAEHGHAKALERKQPMALLPLRLKMQQKLNVLVLHIALPSIISVVEYAQAQKMGVHTLELRAALRADILHLESLLL